MTPPRIALVCYHLEPGRVARWRTGSFAVPEPYVAAVRRAGAWPVLLPPGDLAGPGAEPGAMLEPFDGLLLVGGGDLEPRRYGGSTREEIYGVEPERDETEVELVLAADRAGVPTLAICRGAQVVNVAYGGTLHQHLPELDGLAPHGTPGGGEPLTHDVRVAPASRIRRATRSEHLACSSHHHQGIDRIGKGLVPTAWTDDELVEAVERERGWVVAVQWHPEDTAGRDLLQQALFDELVREAGQRSR
jgi:gamma-glutamyl-gamma-aminobutyrate hydrolase PuuD